MNADSQEEGLSLPLVMEGATVHLRPVSQVDFPAFFQWSLDTSQFHFLGAAQGVSTFENFAARLDAELRGSVTFILVSADRSEIFGYVQAVELRLDQGWCFVRSYAEPEYRGQSAAVEATVMFLDYMFRTFDLRKIYMEVYESELEWLKPLIAAGLVQEGKFEQHIWAGDKYQDVVRLVLDHGRWLDDRRQALFLIGLREEASEIITEQHRE